LNPKPYTRLQKRIGELEETSEQFAGVIQARIGEFETLRAEADAREDELRARISQVEEEKDLLVERARTLEVYSIRKAGTQFNSFTVPPDLPGQRSTWGLGALEIPDTRQFEH
jgi:hypothetical protein